MIKFINKLTGTVMYVSEDRAQEYKEAGHTPASDSPHPKTTRSKAKKAEV